VLKVSRYPKEYEKIIFLRDGTKVLLRPELSTDTDMLWEMFSTLSKESLRFLGRGFTRERIEKWTSKIDYNELLPIVAVVDKAGKKRIVACATLQFFLDSPAFKHKANFGIIVHDDYQNKGLGTSLTKHMLEIAKKMELRKVSLGVATENWKALHIYEKCGFKIEARLKEDGFADGRYYDNYIMSIFL